MKPRITVLTLGVDDLERSLEFYQNGQHLPTEGILGQEFENGAVAFFDLQNGSQTRHMGTKKLSEELANVPLSPENVPLNSRSATT